MNPSFLPCRVLVVAAALLAAAAPPAGGGEADRWRPFLERHCVECHDREVAKGGLNLADLSFDPTHGTNFARWVLVHDRSAGGEMPPAKKPRPTAAELGEFAAGLSNALATAERERLAGEGRATRRRLNRYEYEHVLRDLLATPWLQLRDALPEDGEAFRFNKVGDALDVSHVQMARYLGAAEKALRDAMAPQAARPPVTVTRHYAREQPSYAGAMKFSVFNTAPERATFPVLGFAGEPAVRRGDAPITVGDKDPVRRELEGMGVVASAYEPIEPKFNAFRAPVSARYRLRFNAHTVWVGPGKSNRWYIPDLDNVSRGRRDEPVTITAETPPRLLRHLGDFDVTPDPAVHELEVHLLAGEIIRPDAGRLFRSRPGAGRWQNPLAETNGQPGVVFRWMEVEGPLYESWPPPGHQRLFGNLPLADRAAAAAKAEPASAPRAAESGGRRRPAPVPRVAGVDVISTNPMGDAGRLLAGFLRQAYRGTYDERAELDRFLPVIREALAKGGTFTDAMIAGYTAVLCSPAFLGVEEKPGRLDDEALAARLSFFLWNTAPDDELRRLAIRGALGRPEILRAQTDRLLADPRARRFVDGFLDYWLDLRRLNATSPDAVLYPDYYLDDLLVESALAETQLFFAELLRDDLPVRHLVASDFAMLNERLSRHYGLPPVTGVALRRTPLPSDSVRGGLLTQAAVLKVTANGTTTSPVLRGAWVMERILGQKPPPPPPSVPAVEPDIRGATTIRQQLEKHRTVESCGACHARIDPPGFALENFDVLGGWRERYRSETGGEPVRGLAKSGQKFTFHLALPVDASGELADGRRFQDIREFKQLLLADERGLARNLARQLAVYATGAPVRFSDRAAIEALLDRARTRDYGVRTLVHELVQGDLFRRK
ncbi:MAG: hypothetical protein RJA22_2511 [Verrucomicrobiota bacterium]